VLLANFVPSCHHPGVSMVTCRWLCSTSTTFCILDFKNIITALQSLRYKLSCECCIVNLQ